MESGDLAERRAPSVFVFNPFAEGYIAQGKAFTPVKHQALLARDLESLPQFLGEPGDVVLVAKRPSADFQHSLQSAGFPQPEFVELRDGRIDPADKLCQQKVGSLRPWAWGPDSVRLLEPLFARMIGEAPGAQHSSRRALQSRMLIAGVTGEAPGAQHSSRRALQSRKLIAGVTGEAPGAGGGFNDNIARLYSKAWSANFLSKVLARSRGLETRAWLCSEQEASVAVATLEDALRVVAAIRGRGHHRVVVKEAHGLAGHNAIRLWEPEVLPAQRKWMAQALSNGGQLVVEPWLEREVDFSVQLEMGPRTLKLRGYTGLVNDRKGQYLANWAEANYRECPPANVAGFFRSTADISACLKGLYSEVFALLEADLQSTGFVGPVSIDAFVYRTSQGEFRLKPVVEINPRYTMGRLTLELMKHTCPGTCGLFRLVSRAQAHRDGFADFPGYARTLGERFPLRLEGESARKIREGALCLNDPGEAQVCLATFEAGPELNLHGSWKEMRKPGKEREEGA